MSVPGSYAETIETYAADVLSGRVLACEFVKQTVKRHLADLKRFKGKRSEYVWSEWHAEDICAFAEQLPHIEGRWETPTIVLEPWQVFCLGTIFGWRRRSDMARRFTKVYWEVARKNAKSTIAAVVSLYCFTCEDEPAPYIFIGATTGAQALKVFHPIRMMALKTSALCAEFGLKVFAKSITEPGGGYIQTINSKGSTQDGHNPHVTVLDEVHAHETRALYDVMDSASGARTNSLMWLITTAGFNVLGVCYEQRKYLVQILAGAIKADHFWGIIYTLDAADEQAAREGRLDKKNWIKANPNLGKSVRVENLEAAALEAASQPGKAGEFLTKRMNVWTTARNGHISIPKWDKCNGGFDLAQLAADGVPCWGGLDLASVSDLTSFRLVWLHEGKLVTWGTRYLPEAAVAERTARNAVPYERWANTDFLGRRYLTVTEGDTMDYTAVEKDIREALTRFNVKSIGFDPWNAHDLAQRLLADEAPMIEVRQGFASLSPAVKEIDRRYLDRKLVHGGDEILKWCASNVVAVKDDNDNIRPSKKHSMEKIDDYSALVNATAVMLTTEAEEDWGDTFASPIGMVSKEAA